MDTLENIRQAILTTGFATDGTLRSVVPRPLSDEELAEVVHWAGQERLDGLAWLVLAGPDSPWPITDQQRVDLLDCHLGGLRATVAAEATAVWAIGILQAVNVSSWLLKGLASGHVDYPDPALRTSFDADLLVARRDLGRALDGLLAAGCRRTAPPLRGWWERRYARAVELVSPDGIEVDLHAAVADGAFGATFDHDALCWGSDKIEVGGQRCRVLSPASRLVATSAALVLTRGPNLRLARDIAQMVNGGVDVDAARQLAGKWANIVDEALAQSNELLGDPVEVAQLDDSVVAGRSPGWTADALGAWRSLPWWERPQYAIGVLWPSRANLTSRGHTRRSHLRQLAGRSQAVMGRVNPS